MRDSTERQRRRTGTSLRQRQDDETHARKALEDRCAAVRRWLEEDEDHVLRGID